ncbi:MAG: hypothetical protein NTY35_13750 [Planctomycetota bacterium]|nr:hypothetical protein [Planctomycetota bacterium]
MSSIGKIFVVLNLVLAAAFVGWAANAVSTSGDWKKKYEDAVALAGKDKLALEDELKKVRADLGLSKTDLQNAVAARDEAKRAQERLTSENKDLSARNSNLDASVTKIETTLGEITASRDKAFDDTKKALAAQKSADEARRTAELAQQKAEEAKAAAESQMRDIQNQVASLEKEKTKLINETGSLQTSLDTLVANTGVNVIDFANVPKIDGAVLGVETSVAPGLVAINAGSVQGVKRGFTFEIFDGGTYKGQVRIEFVHGDMASGLITRTVPGQTIRQGDGATTRL